MKKAENQAEKQAVTREQLVQLKRKLESHNVRRSS
jgi:hypothetical protein